MIEIQIVGADAGPAMRRMLAAYDCQFARINAMRGPPLSR
jgi:hypothetical protein